MLDALELMGEDRVSSAEEAARICRDERGIAVTARMICDALDRAVPPLNDALNKARETRLASRWQRDLAAGNAYTRRTGEPLCEELIRFARSIVDVEAYRYLALDGSNHVAPPGAPSPRDWAVWAARVLDEPFEFQTAPSFANALGGVLFDPRAIALSFETASALPLPRAWDPERGQWIER